MDATPESIVQLLLHTPLASFVGKQLRDTGFKYLKDKLTSKETYQERLVERVREFLQRQNERFVMDFTQPLRYFWHSNWVWHHVLTYRFYESAPPTLLLADLPIAPNMVIPTQAQLTKFCKELWAFLEEDADLRRLFAAENYQTEVFAGNNRITQQLTQQYEQLLERMNALSNTRDSSIEIEKVLQIVENAYIRQFQPYSALKLLEQVAEHLLPDREPKLVAYHHFLLGLAHTEAGAPQQAHPHFVRAKELRAGHPRFDQAALLSQAHYGTPIAARELAEDLLARDSLNAIAHAVLIAQTGNEQLATSLAQLPTGVAENQEFRRHIIGLLPEVDYSVAELIFNSDLLIFPAPAALTFDNRKYWALVAQFIVLHGVGNTCYEQPDSLPNVAIASPQLLAAHDFLRRYHALLQPTEKYALLGNYWYLLGLAGYYLTGSPADFASFHDTFAHQPQAMRQQYGPFYALLLARWAEPTTVLAILDQLPADDYGNADFLRYQQYIQLGQTVEAQASLAASLNSSSIEASTAYTRARLYLERYCLDEISRTTFLEQCDRRGQLDPDQPGGYLLQAAAYLASEAQQAKASSLLQQAEALLAQHSAPNYLFDLAGLYSLARDYKRANALLSPELATADGRYREQLAQLYLHNLYQQRTNSQELLDQLRAWRQQYTPVRQFCRWEIELAALGDDWLRLVEVAYMACVAFSDDDYFRWELIRGLHLMGNKSALQTEIRHLAANHPSLPRALAFNVASIAKIEGLLAEGLHLAYPFAIDRTDIEARKLFVQLFLPNGHEVEITPTEATVGVTVTYSLGGQIQPPLLLTDNLLSTNRHAFASRLVGLSLGGRFSYADRSGVLKSGEVTALYGPYQALFLDIVQQSEEHDALELQQFHVPAGDMEQFQALLMQQFGQSEDERRRRINELLDDVRAGRQGFSAVARSVCAGNGWDAYRLLTSAEGRGLRLVPALCYAGIVLHPELTYVLDWSTLPLFYHLHELGLITLPKSLWVARQVPDFLRALLEAKKRSPASKLSVMISAGFVRPVFYADDYQNQEVTALTHLLTWVEQHCQTRLVPEKLDLLRQGQQENRTWLDDDENDYLTASFDVLFLANQPDTVVISDDLTLLPLLQKHGQVISSEKYLRTFYADTFTEHFLPILLRLRYTGLQVEATALYRVFLAEGGRFLNSALTYLESVGYDVLSQGFTGAYLPAFLKQVYLTPTLLPDQKDRAALAVYAQALQYADQLTPALRQQLINELTAAFHLLPQYQDRLIPLFHIVWQQAIAARRAKM